ncbi:MAG TPA: response regulator [Gemmatimonadales bacterium]|nr:response regulator [Gemmatimonadales bacterium]
MTGIPAATTDERAIDAQVERALTDRVMAGEPMAQLAHFVLIAVVAFLLWGIASSPLLLAWVATVVVGVVVRAASARHLSTTKADSPTTLRAVRLAVTALGLAWGAGAAAIVPDVPPRYMAMLLVVLCGLVAGAAHNLDADPPAFRRFLVTSLGPLLVGIPFSGRERVQLVAIVLILIFGGFMVVLNRRAHRLLNAHLRSSALLALREQEAQRERRHLDALIDSAPLGIVVVDRENRVQRVNPRFQDLFGYTSDQAVGRDLDDLIVPPGDRTTARGLNRQAQETGRAVAEVDRRRKDGRVVPVRVSAAPVEGGVSGDLFVQYEDISERRQAEQVMREARDTAERLAKARSSFLANMSHEIRTPMNAVVGFVELLLDTELTTDQRRALELVRSSAEALLTILNDVLDFSKIEAEHLELEEIPFDLQKLLHSTVGLLAVRAREKHLELITDIGMEFPSLVRGDPTRIRQVLTNLIGNAIKFTDEGEVVVRAVATPSGENAVRVEFAVRDTGIGISREQLTSIFQEFTQADASMTRRYGGTGLGLAIARKLVTLMGGELTVESEVGRGSTFAFSLPFPVEATSARAGTSGVSLGSRRVLIVDDNETNRRILRDILAGAGMALREAASAAAGLAALREARQSGAPVELAIIDQQMPEQDGFSLASEIRATPDLAGTRLLLLTSAGQRGDAQRCREVGINGYLTKPIARADLLEALSALFAGPAAAGPDEGIITRHTIAEARRRMHILLAEDNPVNQQVAATMLRKRGHEVDVVADGAAAVAAARATVYDVVLMDIQMPEMDGFAATEAIRAMPERAGLPIIALTAHALSGERERCLSHGMTGYLTKPFRSHELFGLVEGWAEPPASPVAAAAPPPAPAPVPNGPVDLEHFRRTMREAGAEEAVDSILDTFLETAPERLAVLGAAVERDEAAGIAAAAHAFKSAAGSIGARGLASLLGDAERAARAGDGSGARGMYDRIKQEAGAVVEYVRRARNERREP